MVSTKWTIAFTATSLVGASAEPTYSGGLSFMRRAYTKNTDGADVVIWGIPFDGAVSNRPGRALAHKQFVLPQQFLTMTHNILSRWICFNPWP